MEIGIRGRISVAAGHCSTGQHLGQPPPLIPLEPLGVRPIESAPFHWWLDSTHALGALWRYLLLVPPWYGFESCHTERCTATCVGGYVTRLTREWSRTLTL